MERKTGRKGAPPRICLSPDFARINVRNSGPPSPYARAGHALAIDTNPLHHRRVRIERIGDRLPAAIRLLRIDR
jgi:hypothetical protein